MVDDPRETLREGVERLCAQNSALFAQREVSPKAQMFFRCHDTAHVVFGCDTSIFGEGVLKVFTIFGTTLGFWRHLFAYAEADAFALFRQYSWRHIMRSVFKLLASLPRAFAHARRMSKPWPWSEYDEYLDKPISEIRNEFQIEVVLPK